MLYLLFTSQLKFSESTSPLFPTTSLIQVFGWSRISLGLTPIPCWPLHFAHFSGAPGPDKLVQINGSFLME